MHNGQGIDFTRMLDLASKFFNYLITWIGSLPLWAQLILWLIVALAFTFILLYAVFNSLMTKD